MKSWNITGIEFNEEDIEKAMEALDDNIYDENSFITNKLGNEYNFESHKGNLYGPKRIVECICKNKNQPVPSNLNSTDNLRRHIEDAGFEMIIKSENKSGNTSLKKEGNNMQQVNLDDEGLKEKIKLFFDRCFEADHGKKKVSQKTKEYKNIYYNDYKISVSFGKGDGAATFWFAFLNYGQEVQKGIYPVLLYNLYTGVGNNKNEVLENNLEICYGVSADDESDISWPEDITSNYPSSESNNYKDSYIKNVYTINNKNDIDNNIENIIKDINLILQETTRFFKKREEDPEGSGTGNNETPNNTTPKNQILYGPPGTGKTYNTVVKAMEIIGIPEKPSNDYDEEEIATYNNILEKLKSDTDEKEFDDKEYKIIKKEFDKLVGSQIEFITFHQSYSYEEFVEGIKPYIPEWGENAQDVNYVGKDGIFKKVCRRALSDFNNIWEIFKQKYHDKDKIKGINSYQEIEYANNNNSLKSKSGNILNKEKLEKYYNKHLEQPITDTNRLQQVAEELGEGNGTNGADSLLLALFPVFDEIKNSDELFKLPKPILNQPYVLIIDEINRGNISKIFGELITLIEEDKRAGEDNAITVTLPYSGNSFSVPKNLYIIGTMNTADRSIALLDTALRRRFDFEEMPPDSSLLIGKGFGNINYKTLLDKLNENICAKDKGGLDKDHKIGHAFLINADNNEDKLKRAFLNKIYPLLEEYFYDNADTIAKVLNCEKTNYLSNVNDNWDKILRELCEVNNNNNKSSEG